MERVNEDTQSLRGTLDSSSIVSRGSERSSKLSMLFDFDDQLFASKSYKAMIRKTVKMSIRSPDRNAPAPEGVVTRVFSNGVGSTASAQPLLGNTSGPVVRKRNGSKKIVLLGGYTCLSLGTYRKLTTFQGQGESAKTTFVKQLQWAYASGFSTDERDTWRIIIHDNLAMHFESLAAFSEKYDDLDVSFSVRSSSHSRL